MDDELTLIAAKHKAGVSLKLVEAGILLDHYADTIARIKRVLEEMGSSLI